MTRFLRLGGLALAVSSGCSGGMLYDPDDEHTTTHEGADAGAHSDESDDSTPAQPDVDPDDADDDPSSNGSDDDDGPAVDDPSSQPTSEPGVVPPAPGETTRLARLTHEQYANTVADLLGVEGDVTAGFAPDALNGFAFSTSVDYPVDKRLGPQYRSAAEQLAEQVVASPEAFAHVSPCQGTAVECRDDFVTNFGLRAFRRPLTQAETTRFSDLFDLGPELVASGDAYRDGVQLVIEAMLQSPQFIYRTELSEGSGPDGIIPLDPWEAASRLSYFLYDSMPDQALLAAAADDGLGTAAQIRAHVERMLDDPRAARKLVSFHEQAWHFDRFSKVAPDPDVYPGLPADLAARLRAASTRYVEEVVASGGGLPELLTAPFAYADSALAPLYLEDLDGDELARIDFDEDGRRGFLMQVGFLAANAYAIKTDPIHRGLFVVRDLLCRVIPDPPANASMSMLPDGAPSPETTRQEVALLTSPDDCVGCHLQINPPGFAFEGFDAMGQARSEENGHAVEVAVEFTLDGEARQFSGPIDLVQALAASSEAERCYARKWLEFARGRSLTRDELTVIDELDGSVAVRQLVVDIATSGAFLERHENARAPVGTDETDETDEAEAAP